MDTGLRVTNSLTQQLEAFVPADPAGKRVTWYACGPTVYGPIHIGNARTFVMTDVMRRWMTHLGYQVEFAQNITDIDDKIIARGHEEGLSAQAVAQKYEALFYEHLGLLGVTPASQKPRCTDYMPQQIEFIQKLIDKGIAYATADGSAWYSVRAFPEYGKLSKRRLDDLVEGSRVEAEMQKLKRDPLDFALWKAAKPGEPAWEAPWGRGRPGWHLECSCMSMAALQTETLDVHSGGSDLVFPHHENEIAQSEALTGKPFARYWLHCGMLRIDGAKMSKSAGNYWYIDALLEKVDVLALRHFLTSAQYRAELNFSPESIEEAGKASRRYADAYAESVRTLGNPPAPDAWQGVPDAQAFYQRFRGAMNEDFNTPGALAVLFDVTGAINKELHAVGNGSGDRGKLHALASLLALFRQVLGLTPELQREAAGVSDELTGQLLELLIEVRSEARKAKAFPIADMVRDRLGQMGITLQDSKDGTTWKRD